MDMIIDVRTVKEITIRHGQRITEIMSGNTIESLLRK